VISHQKGTWAGTRESLAAHGPANTVILTNKVSRPTISTHNGLVYLKNRMKTTLAYFEVQYTKYNTRKKNTLERLCICYQYREYGVGI
jgi:hypothetical protein